MAKKILLLLLIFYCFGGNTLFAQTYNQIPVVDITEKIYDYADLFSDSEEQDLYNKVIEYIQFYNMDMAIVTIDDNPKSNAMNFADDFYDYNIFGIGPNYDGLLFLIDMDTREMWISTTGKAILIYDDARIDKILDATYNYIKNSQYYDCAISFIEESGNYALSGVASSNQDYIINNNGDYVRRESSQINSDNMIIILILSLIIPTVIVIVGVSKHKVIKAATHANKYLVNESFKLTEKSDTFISTRQHRTYSPQNTSSGGSSFGSSSGGSSTHRSSSGSTHGGGGRSF